MNITVIGAGYVGLVTGTCLADVGNNILCLDLDKEKISSLKKPLTEVKKFTDNFDSLKNSINIKSVFSFFKKINNIKNSNIS